MLFMKQNSYYYCKTSEYRTLRDHRICWLFGYVHFPEVKAYKYLSVGDRKGDAHFRECLLWRTVFPTTVKSV